MKKAICFVILSAFLLNSCKPPNEPWKNLIGSNLDNWIHQKGSASYEIQDSVIAGIAAVDSISKNSWLCTKDEFKDFILEYEAWTDEGINSGVQIRCNRNPLHLDGNATGYKIVIDQSEKSWTGGIYDDTGRFWLYTLERNPEGKKAWKRGEWNHFRIEAFGNSIRTWVNGIPCADLIDDTTLSGFIGLNIPGIGSDSTKMGKVVKWKNLRILTDHVQKYLTPYQPVIIQNSYLTNTLSRREADEGWKLLWDGKTTNGWRGAKLKAFPSGGWIVKDGTLSTIENGGTRSPNGGDIVTIDKFRNYEFMVDFSYTPASNSGIKYFVDTELNKDSPGSAIGCEYSILDEILHPDSKDGIDGNRNLAGVYDVIAPLPRLDNGVGNWNRAMIIVKGSHVEHWLNGQKTLEYERGSDSWREHVAMSKFKVWPYFGEAIEGHILLQDHGNAVSFRNIKIKELEPGGPFFGNGIHNGWVDQNSAVIWTRLTQFPELNLSGRKFLVPSRQEHHLLDSTANRELIYKAQIPEGFTLHQMDGACPGMPGEVKLIYFPLLHPELKTESGWEPVDENKNFTRQWRLENLVPGTKYIVEIEARANNRSENKSRISGTFNTAPDASKVDNIDFCIVTCQDYNNRDDSTKGHSIYNTMLKLKPDFFVHTGDIEYYDQPEPYALTEELMRFKWDRVFALPYQRDFYRQVTTYNMKDDHDALRNDAYPGMRYGTVSWERGLEIFDKEQFPSNDPAYKTIRWGKDLQIWLMEGRNYRGKNIEPDSPAKTIWGEKQKSWLFQTLKESDATFKLIISPGPILGPDRDNKNDNHSNIGYASEGNQIREFLKQFDNVFISNGDRHWQYVTNIRGTNLWEFGCGPSSDIHAEGWSQDDLRPEHKFLRVKGGFLKGSVFHAENMTRMRFQHCDVDGNVVHEEIFPK